MDPKLSYKQRLAAARLKALGGEIEAPKIIQQTSSPRATTKKVRALSLNEPIPSASHEPEIVPVVGEPTPVNQIPVETPEIQILSSASDDTHENENPEDHSSDPSNNPQAEETLVPKQTRSKRKTIAVSLDSSMPSGEDTMDSYSEGLDEHQAKRARQIEGTSTPPHLKVPSKFDPTWHPVSYCPEIINAKGRAPPEDVIDQYEKYKLYNFWSERYPQVSLNVPQIAEDVAQACLIPEEVIQAEKLSDKELAQLVHVRQAKVIDQSLHSFVSRIFISSCGSSNLLALSRTESPRGG